MGDDDREIKGRMCFLGLVPTREEIMLEQAMERDKKQADEMQQLAAFGAAVLEELKLAINEGLVDVDLEYLADLAVECRLVEYVPYDPEKHGLNYEGEAGDMIYYWGEK